MNTLWDTNAIFERVLNCSAGWSLKFWRIISTGATSSLLPLNGRLLCYMLRVRHVPVGFSGGHSKTTSQLTFSKDVSHLGVAREGHVITRAWRFACEWQGHAAGVKLIASGLGKLNANTSVAMSASHDGLTLWNLNKMADIWKTTFSKAFRWKGTIIVWFKFDWNMFPRV